jgi:hypothetical protein
MCKQIYDENEDMLWKINTLDIETLLYHHRLRGFSIIAEISESVSSRVQAVYATSPSILFPYSDTFSSLFFFFLKKKCLGGVRLLKIPSNSKILLDQAMLTPGTCSHLDIGFTSMTKHGEHITLRHILRELHNWSSLKSLTLISRDGLSHDLSMLGHSGLRHLLRFRARGHPVYEPPPHNTIYHDHLDVLREAGSQEGYLSHLERKIVMDFGPPEITENGKIRRLVREFGNLNTVIAEIGNTFRCPVVIDGKTCYEKGVLV